MAGKGSLGRVVSPEQKKKTAESLHQFYEDHPEAKQAHSLRMKRQMQEYPEGTKKRQQAGGRAAKPLPESMLSLSKRTVTKIMKRLGVGCSRCGWKEATCDVHHIQGRKIPDPHNHKNLTYVCPNCHRLAHTKKIKPEELISLEQQIGERWKSVYYPNSGLSGWNRSVAVNHAS